MFCKQCGTQLDDKALFCKNCGAQTGVQQQQPAQQAQPVQQPVYQQPVQQAQPVYQQPVQQAQPVYQQPVYQQPVYQQPYAQPAMPKKSNGKLIAIILGAVAVVAAIAVALVLILGGGSSAGGGTGGDANIETEAGGEINNIDLESKGTVNAMIGSLQNIATANGADFEFYGFADGEEVSLQGSVLFDLDTLDIMLDVEAEVDGYDMGIYIYDGYGITKEGRYLYATEFDVEEFGSIYAEMLDMMDEYNLTSMSFSGDSIVAILEDTLGEDEIEMIEMVMDFDDLADAIDTVIESINDDDWLEENLDKYKRTTKNGVTSISMEISSFKFVGGLMDLVLPLLDFSMMEDMYGMSMDEDMLRDQLEMMIEDELYYMDDFCIKLDLVIDNNVISDLAFYGEMDGEVVQLELHIENLGNPSIDEDKLADLLDSAEIY